MRTRSTVIVVVLVGLVAAVGGGLVVGGGLLAWSWFAESRTPALVREDCDTNPTLSGFQGWCVQTRQADGPFGPPCREVYIVAVQDGQKMPRITHAPFPYLDPDDYRVTFDDGGITLTDGSGVTVTYPESYYALD